ncbi:CobW domain-containing protein [Panus rudis PR-1116 ss-1]|nr:CobW domain-containing protein [Panus rudis PR-1116 ss-1]
MADDEEIPTLIESDPPALLDGQATVPLTIICGFLGAGKSTLIKRILTERHGYRIAVIMNEFGDTADIEAKTINVSSPDNPAEEPVEEFLELANGCLCCSIKDTGIAAIEKLMQRKGAFDHILLETTGLADPGPIAAMFWQNEEYAMGLGKDIHLDGVVCVVDAVFGKKQMEEDHAASGIGESLRQIAGSDVILVNKVDLVSPAQLEELESMISNVNPGATIYRTIQGQIDLKYIMGIDAYSAKRALPAQPSTTATEASCSDPDHDHEHDHSSARHYELRGISSLQVTCPVLKSPDLEKFDQWIREVLWEGRLPGGVATANKIEVLRCKGIIRVEGGETHVLQGVRSMYELFKLENASSADLGLPDAGKVVLIGKGLDEAVRRSLQDVLET